MNPSSVLRCHDLHKHYGEHAVLHGIELNVAKGSVHGLVGLNGAGKTTTLECILGLKSRDRGTVSILNFSPEQLYRAQGKVSVVFDSPCLYPQLTVRQTLDYAKLQHPASSLSAPELEALLGIERYRHFKVRQLSLGNRRRLSIAQALIDRPEFVILDEPFNGLDAGGVDDVLALIRELNDEQGTSFLLASHQLSYLEKICSHMAIIHNGKVQVSESLDKLLRQDVAIVSIIASDPRQARIVVRQIEGVQLMDEDEGTEIRCRLDSITSAELNTKLVGLGIAVEQLILHKPTLESLFHTTVNEAQP